MKAQKSNQRSFFKYLKRIIFIIPVLLAASWDGGSAQNAPVCTAPGDQDANYKGIVYAGDEKAIIAWRDNRNESNGSDIYAQRVNIHGEVFWTKDGIVVCDAPENQYNPRVVQDGQGGVIIAWVDARRDTASDIYAQRVDSSGTMLWPDNGIAVFTATGASGGDIDIISDGQGGALLIWADMLDYRPTFFAQRLDSSGQRVWTEDGVHIGGISSNMDAKLTTDGSDGAIIAWTDNRNSSQSNFDIYAQHLNGAGISQWTQDDAAVTQADYGQRVRGIASDKAGGAIIAWYDWRGDDGLYTQRVDNSGNMVWVTYGVAFDSTTYHDVEIKVTSDNAGGAYYIWTDRSFSSDQTSDIYGQRMGASDSHLWGLYGAPVCDHQGYQISPRAVHDGLDGIIVIWNDNRDNDSTGWDIYAQRINSSGGKIWTDQGICISNEQHYQGNPEIAGCDSLGAIIVWSDSRNLDTGGRDIYMQGVDLDGNLYDVPTSISHRSIEKLPTKVKLYQNYPNPFNPVTYIRYELSCSYKVSISIYNVMGQKIKTFPSKNQNPGYHTVVWDGTDDAGRKVGSGIYYCRVSAGSYSATKKMILLK